MCPYVAPTLYSGCTMGYPIWVAVIIVKRFETLNKRETLFEIMRINVK